MTTSALAEAQNAATCERVRKRVNNVIFENRWRAKANDELSRKQKVIVAHDKSRRERILSLKPDGKTEKRI